MRDKPIELTDEDIMIWDTISGNEVLGIEFGRKQENFNSLKNQILTAQEKAKKWDDFEKLQSDPRLKSVTMSYREILELKQIKQRLDDEIKDREKQIQSNEDDENSNIEWFLDMLRLIKFGPPT